MKTAKFLCAAAIAALTALVSCNKDPDIPEPLVNVSLTLNCIINPRFLL